MPAANVPTANLPVTTAEFSSNRNSELALPLELPTHAPRHVRRSWAFRMRGVIGGAITIVGGVLVLLTLNPEPRSGSWTEVAVDGMAWTTFLAGGLIRFWATLYIGSRKGHTLIDDGPYSVCRHPLYLGTFLVAAAIGMFLHSAPFAALLAVVVVYYLRYTIPGEEAELRARLGAPHIAYCHRVPLVWPRWSQFHTSDVIPVSASALARECRRTARWAWLPILGDVVTHLRLQPWWPNVFELP